MIYIFAWCRNKGISFVAIDQNRPLSDQGPFDVVLHKVGVDLFFMETPTNIFFKNHFLLNFFFSRFVGGWHYSCDFEFVSVLRYAYFFCLYLEYVFKIWNIWWTLYFSSCQEWSGARSLRFVHIYFVILLLTSCRNTTCGCGAFDLQLMK